jgi:putative glycosyltransferase (TIGR04372 family)
MIKFKELSESGVLELKDSGNIYKIDARKLILEVDGILQKNRCERRHIWNLFQVDRAGHSVLDPRIFVSIFGVDLSDTAILIPKGRKIANRAYLEYFCHGAQFIEIDNLKLAYILHCLEDLIVCNDRYYYLIGRNLLALQRRMLPERIVAPSIPTLNIDHWTQDCLARYDLKHRPFVVLHHRTTGWFDAPHHSNRNSNFENLIPAIAYLRKSGFEVVRIGDKSMQKIPKEVGVIDSVYFESRKDYDDIVLIKNCYFYFGTSSGPLAIAEVMETPVLSHNFVSNTNSFGGYTEFLLKNYFSINRGRYLSFKEIFISGAGFCQVSSTLERNGIYMIENGSREILKSAVQFQESLKLSHKNRLEKNASKREVIEEINKTLIKNDKWGVLDVAYSCNKVPSDLGLLAPTEI